MKLMEKGKGIEHWTPELRLLSPTSKSEDSVFTQLDQKMSVKKPEYQDCN